MKKSEVRTGMIVEVWNPFAYFTKDFRIDDRSIAMITQKLETNCRVEVCKKYAHGGLRSTGIARTIRYEDLRIYKHKEPQGTKWWK